MAILKVLSGPTAGHCFDLSDDQAVVGRDLFCEIVLPSHSVSRQHARIARDAEGYFIEDLGSLNGTYVNGARVTRRTALNDQDRIHIYETVLSFSLQSPLSEAILEPERAAVEPSPEPSATKGMQVLGALDGAPKSRAEFDASAKLRAVLDITRRLGRSTAIDEFLPATLESLFEVFPQADRGYILMSEPATGSLKLKAAKLRRGEVDSSLTLGPISRSVAERVMEQGEAVLTGGGAATGSALDDLDALSQMSAPLVGTSDRPIGILHIESHDSDRAFVAADLDVLVSLATVAAQAVDRAGAHEARLRLDRRERELATAREVQLHFLPPQAPEIAEYQFFQYYRAAEDVGGDYFDYITMADGRLAIAMGDVSGKGVSAALLMARLCSDVRFSVASNATPEDVVEQLHAELAGPAMVDRFVTFLLLALDAAAHRLTVVSAGHMPPLLRHRVGGAVEEIGLQEAGPPLGVAHERRYLGVPLTLDPGDTLVIYTDGIRDATNRAGKIFGQRRTLAAIAHSDGTPDGVGRSLLDAVSRHCMDGPQTDDICVVCFGRNFAKS